MSEKRFDSLGWINWLLDQYLFPTYSSLRSKTPWKESEESAEYKTLREQARQADLKEKLSAKSDQATGGHRPPLH